MAPCGRRPALGCNRCAAGQESKPQAAVGTADAHPARPTTHLLLRVVGQRRQAALRQQALKDSHQKALLGQLQCRQRPSRARADHHCMLWLCARLSCGGGGRRCLLCRGRSGGRRRAATDGGRRAAAAVVAKARWARPPRAAARWHRRLVWMERRCGHEQCSIASQATCHA